MKSRARVADRLRANFAAAVEKAIEHRTRAGYVGENIDDFQRVYSVFYLIGYIESHEPELARALGRLMGSRTVEIEGQS